MIIYKAFRELFWTMKRPFRNYEYEIKMISPKDNGIFHRYFEVNKRIRFPFNGNNRRIDVIWDIENREILSLRFPAYIWSKKEIMEIAEGTNGLFRSRKQKKSLSSSLD